MVFYVSGGQPFARMEGTGGLGFCLFCLAMRPRGLGHWHTAGTQGLLNERMNKCSSREIKQSLSPKIIQLSPCLSSKEKKYVSQWWEEEPKQQVAWPLTPGQKPDWLAPEPTIQDP